MNIFFDHQTFSQQAYGGISRYYAELITGINRTSDVKAHLPLIVSNNVHLREMGIPARPFFAEKKMPKKLQTIYYLNKLYTIHELQQKSYNVFHSTYYDPYFLPYLKGKPFVITFLDMIHEKFGSQFKELAYDGIITARKRVLANRADRIIAISESTKYDLIELLDVDPSKVDVIYLGNSLTPKSHVESNQLAETPYLLFVGNRTMYKNFLGLLNAIHPLLKQYRIKLLCAGGGVFTNDEKRIIYSLKIDEVVEQRPINDQTLSILYQNAIAFIFPTLYEGFGIPILEAFACNCPCIVSHTSSLPEVAGDAVLYIDPLSPESIYNAVKHLLNDLGMRKSLIQKGIEQLNKFSWQRTVNETINLYQTVA